MTFCKFFLFSMKEELAEQKKAEDKARRDAIYQQYLERKAERESSEGDGSSGSSSVPRRLKNKGKDKPPRPKSQPPGGLGAAGIPTDYRNTQNSLRGKSPGPELLKRMAVHFFAG